MTHTWQSNPSMKVEVDSTEITDDSISVVVHRPENALSRVRLFANNYQGKNFIGTLDTFDTLKVSFRYGSDSWTQAFEGVVEDVGPILNPNQQVLSALAYGYGRAIRNTSCGENYGAESENDSLDTPEEIWDDLVDNRINKNFDGNATGYAITKTKIKSVTTPTISFIHGAYRANMDILNEVALIHQAGQGHGTEGVHWFVDTSKNLWIDSIGNHSVDTTNWPTYWGGSQAASTLVEGSDFRQFNCFKRIKNFANKIVLCTDLRKPGYDYWTEDSGGASLWGNDALKSLTDSTTQKVVGSHSLRLETNGANNGTAYYPSGENAGWNFSAVGSMISIPHLSFYYYKDANIAEATTYVRLFTTEHDTNYWYAQFSNWHSDPDNEWVHVSLPIGVYWAMDSENRRWRWAVGAGAPNWADVDGVAFNTSLAGGDALLYIDDLHFSGKIIREAYNSYSIDGNDPGPPLVTQKKEHQKVVHLNTAVDDSMVAATDTGTAARLAHAELLRLDTQPIVGTVETPGIVDVLPGELVHIHADKETGGTFRIDKDFRVKEVIHSFTPEGFLTALDLTDDLYNTLAAGSNELMDVLAKATFIDPNAKSLKTTGIDPFVTRLSRDYPFDDD